MLLVLDRLGAGSPTASGYRALPKAAPASSSCRGLDDEVEPSDIQQESLDHLLGDQHEDGGWSQTNIKPSDALSTSCTFLSLAWLHRHFLAS